jgi:hypothetical protein
MMEATGTFEMSLLQEPHGVIAQKKELFKQAMHEREKWKHTSYFKCGLIDTGGRLCGLVVRVPGC